MSPASKRVLVSHFVERYAMSERHACVLAEQDRSVQRYASTREDDPALVQRLVELAKERPRCGYRRLTVLLQREDFDVNHKRVHRIYSELQLAVRRKTRKRASQAPREARPKATTPNECWSMDFMSDSMTDGRMLRLFTAVDDYSKLCVSLVCDVSLPAARIVRELDAAIERHGKPRAIRTDNGPEFTSKLLDVWAYERGIEHHFIRPGKPIENAIAESFNGRVRDELLNQHCFSSVRHAVDLAADWRADYNAVRPHTSLGGLSPLQYLEARAVSEGSSDELPSNTETQPLTPRTGVRATPEPIKK